MRKIADWMKERESKKWWRQHLREYEKTKGKIEGLGVRETLARTYFEEGKYLEASDMWNEMAEISSKYPSTKGEAQRFYMMAEKLRRKAEEQGQISPAYDKGESRSGLKRHPTGYIIPDEVWEKYVEKHPEFKGKRNPTKKDKGLEEAFIIIGLLGCIFFLSYNTTGYAIADLSTKTTSFLGAGFLIVALIAGFFWLKERKR